MNEPEWRGHTLFRRARVLGWIGYYAGAQLWYARTAGTRDSPIIRGTFDNEQSARDFLQFITSVENQ